MPLFSPAGTMPLVTHALVSRSFFLFPFASFLSPLFGSPLMIISLSRYLSSYASAFHSSFFCVFAFLSFLFCIFFSLVSFFSFFSLSFIIFPPLIFLVFFFLLLYVLFSFPPLCLSSFHGFSFSSLFFISLVLPPFCKNAFVYLMAGGSCTFILFKSSRPYSQYSFPFLSFDLLFILDNAASMHFLLSPCSLSVQRLCLASLLYEIFLYFPFLLVIRFYSFFFISPSSHGFLSSVLLPPCAPRCPFPNTRVSYCNSKHGRKSR